jgi:hypothetical protein
MSSLRTHSLVIARKFTVDSPECSLYLRAGVGHANGTRQQHQRLRTVSVAGSPSAEALSQPGTNSISVILTDLFTPAQVRSAGCLAL